MQFISGKKHTNYSNVLAEQQPVGRWVAELN